MNVNWCFDCVSIQPVIVHRMKMCCIDSLKLTNVNSPSYETVCVSIFTLQTVINSPSYETALFDPLSTRNSPSYESVLTTRVFVKVNISDCLYIGFILNILNTIENRQW